MWNLWRCPFSNLLSPLSPNILLDRRKQKASAASAKERNMFHLENSDILNDLIEELESLGISDADPEVPIEYVEAWEDCE